MVPFFIGCFVGIAAMFLAMVIVLREADRGALWLYFIAPRWAGRRRIFKAWCVRQVKVLLDGIHTRDVQ